MSVIRLDGEPFGHQSELTDGALAGGQPAVPQRDIAMPEELDYGQMLERFAHITVGPIIIDTSNMARLLKPVEFAAAYAHCCFTSGKAIIPVTELWSRSKHRMTADRLGFHPSEGKFFTEFGLRHVNLWNPLTWPHADAALAQPFFQHLAYLIPEPGARRDLIDWLAHAIQQPATRPHFHFLLVAPNEGTGRSWVAEVMRALLGDHHAGETDLHRLLDDTFNSVLSRKIVVVVHEVKAPSDERYSHKDRLKSLLTDAWLTVNEKHLPRWTERFCCRFLMFTNRDDAIPLSETDRRIYVVRCVDNPRSENYYRELYAKLGDRTFLAAVWHALQSRDIAQFNPGKRAPLNDMKRQMIAAGRSDEQQTAIDFVQACPHPVIAASDLMHILVPQVDEKERHADRQKRVMAVAGALREVGKQTGPRKVRIGMIVTRVWLLSDTAKWINASAAVLTQAATVVHDECVQERFNAEALIERWTDAL